MYQFAPSSQLSSLAHRYRLGELTHVRLPPSRPDGAGQVVGLVAHADHGKILEGAGREHHGDRHVLDAFAAEGSLRIFCSRYSVFSNCGGRGVRRGAPVGPRREPPRRPAGGLPARGVPGVQVIAVDQLQRRHERFLGRVAAALDQQRTGAAVAEVDDEMDLAGLAPFGRRRADGELQGGIRRQRRRLEPEKPRQVCREFAAQRGGLGEVAHLGLVGAHRGVDGQEQLRPRICHCKYPAW